MDTSQEAAKILSNAERIKKIRKDLTSLSRTIDDPGPFRKQKDLESLMIRLVRLAEMNDIEVYTGKTFGSKTVIGGVQCPV